MQFLILILSVIVACSQAPSTNQEVPKGTLHGKISIGPIRPVERSDTPRGDKSKWYTDKILLVYTSDKKTMIARAPVDKKGDYRCSLEPGRYLVDMKLPFPQRSPDLPKEVEIKPGETVRLNVKIDTGIR